MMSYGLLLLGLLALAVLVAGRVAGGRCRAGGARPRLAVVLAFAAYGFCWWEALPASCTTATGTGSRADRPASYWMWGNLAALVFCAGPMLGAGLARAGASARSLRRRRTPGGAGAGRGRRRDGAASRTCAG